MSFVRCTFLRLTTTVLKYISIWLMERNEMKLKNMYKNDCYIGHVTSALTTSFSYLCWILFLPNDSKLYGSDIGTCLFLEHSCNEIDTEIERRAKELIELTSSIATRLNSPTNFVTWHKVKGTDYYPKGNRLLIFLCLSIYIK